MRSIGRDGEGNIVETVTDPTTGKVIERTVTSPDGSVRNEVKGNAQVGIQSGTHVNNTVIVNGQRVR